MLRLNIHRLLQLRGIERPYSFLVRNGFVPQTATNIVNNNIGHIKPPQLEKLCLLLNCTPNDLFDWHPNKDQVVTPDHALHTLTKRSQTTTTLSQAVRELPLDKLQKLTNLLTDL